MHEMKTLTLNGETFDSFVDQTARQKADEAVRTVNGKNPDENGNIEIKVNAADAAEVAALVARAETAATDAEADAKSARTAATEANNAKGSASAKAILAQTHAGTATEKATAAEESATNASASATRAETAATSADAAATRATEAAERAENASSNSGGNVDLTGYATEEYVQEYAQPKGEYLTEVPSGYATEEFVKNKIAEAELGGEEVDLSGYAQKSELPTKVSQLQNDKGYLTEHQSLSGYATEQFVNDGYQPKGNYLTEVPEGYAKTADIPTKPEDINAQPAGNYALKSEIPAVPVQSVNGKTGAVNLSASDVGARPSTWMPSASDVDALPSSTKIPAKTSELTNDSGFITGYAETDPTVPAWAKNATKPSYTASEVGALPNTTKIPSKTSDLTNDSGFITGYTETDPTVPSWAKASTKPSYSKSEVGLGNVDNVKQYSSSNPPPYPVTSVNGKTGAVTVDVPTVPTNVSAFTNDAGYLTEHLDISGKADKQTVNSLAAEQSALSARMDTFAKLGEGSTTGDAELIDARVDCDGKVWDNAGGHIRGITEKIIEACCDREVVSGGNYNLFKISEVTFQSRLDNTSSDIVSSNQSNLVTGWFPVKYGKYYAYSGLNGGSGDRVTYDPVCNRVQLKLADGTIKVYSNNTGGNVYPVILLPNFIGDGKEGQVRGVDDEKAVAMRIHFGFNGADVSTSAKLSAWKIMIIEGNTPAEAATNAVKLEYLDGDVEMQAETNYTLKHDRTKVDKVSLSPYYRNVNFGVMPFTYYQGLSDSYASAGFTKNTKYTTFIAAWKTLVVNHGGYVTETELGKASDGQSIYLYDFKPVRITNQNKPIPKIIIIAGQHGFEKSNVFGLFHFVDNLLNKWTQHPSLEYLRNHVELMIVPVLNTYGFDTLEYKNANGVNTNRNFDFDWEPVSDTTDPQYGGAEPFDQPETQIVRDLLTMNTDALVVVDFHTCGDTSVTKYEDVNWCGLASNTDSYYNRMLDAVAHHLSAVTAHFNLDYALNQPNVMMGHMTTNADGGKLRNWATDNNFIGVLVEGFNGFPGGTEFSAEVFKANEEIIVNYLITALNCLGR